MADNCYFCGENECLQKHHIVPRRHGGSNQEKNLVTVCPTCHRKLEKLYDESFYSRILDKLMPVGVEKLERYRKQAVEILERVDSERTKGFLYAIETALGINNQPWEKRAESYTTVEFLEEGGERR